MKKYLIVSIALIIGSVLAESLIAYWWVYIIVTTVVVLIARLEGSPSFWVPFLIIGLWFAARMLWYQQADNELSLMMAQLLGLGSSHILILISSLLYAQLAGLGGWSAHLLLKAFNKV